MNATIGLERDRLYPAALVDGGGRGLFVPDDRCLLHIPFGISAVPDSQVQPPIDRNMRAG